MSYILEALKKSQQEREMGQVPHLQATAFDDPLEPARSQPWSFAAIGLAGLAVMLALYAALRPPPAADAPTVVSAEVEQRASTGVESGQGSDRAADDGPVAGLEIKADLGSARGTAGLAGASQQAIPASGPLGAEAGAAIESSAASGMPLQLDDPDDLSVEPQVLVVPAAPKPGERLPRGADELRRAVLGPDASPSIERAQPRPERAPPVREPERDYAPVPPELIAEIEDFKRTYQAGSGGAAAAASQDAGPVRRSAAALEPAERSTGNSAKPNRQASSSERPPPLSSTVRRRLPPFLMTVHVFDKDPARRFVYLNGSKVREGELTRDGFFVEQVLADGAIVRYDEHRFFEAP